MTIQVSKGSTLVLEHARELAIRVLKWSIVFQIGLVVRLGNSTVEVPDARYVRPLGDDRYSRPVGDRN